MAVASAATWALVRYQAHVVAQTGSSAIAADSLHYRGDLLMNGAVVLALVASWLLHWTLVDPLLGLGVAAIVGRSAWLIGREAIQLLMDREFPDDQRKRILELVMTHPEVKGIHDLRTRQAGMQSFIQFHLELDSQMTLQAAHVITDQVERNIQAAFPGAEVLVHADPDSEPPDGLKG
jgi:ferrous-iron efflux pump FieF